MSNTSNSNGLFRKPFNTPSKPDHTAHQQHTQQPGSPFQEPNEGATESVPAAPPPMRPPAPQPGPRGSSPAFGPPPSGPSNGPAFGLPPYLSGGDQAFHARPGTPMPPPPSGPLTRPAGSSPAFGLPPNRGTRPLAPGPQMSPSGSSPTFGPPPNLAGNNPPFGPPPNRATRPLAPGPSGALAAPAQHMFPASNPINGWQQAEQHKGTQKKRRQRKRFKELSRRSQILLVILMIGILIPVISLLVEGISAYGLYSQARDGIAHLNNIKALFSGSGGHTDKYFTTANLTRAQSEMDAAHADFVGLRDQIDGDGFISLAGNLLPQQVTSLRGLTHIGADATVIGQQLMKSAITLAPQLGPALKDPLIGSTSGAPLITQQTLDEAKKDIDFMLPLLRDMDKYSRGVSLDVLPISAQQKQLVSELLPIIPQAVIALPQIRDLMPALGWMVGVDAPRAFLIQTMDRGELRSTGGFTGQFGELDFNAGRMGQINLFNIGPYEENVPDHIPTAEETAIRNKVFGQVAPAPYAWWPIPNFGLRDSNVSVDFPTTARIAMDTYNYEFGKQLEGVIDLSPFAIAQVLQVTGPMSIPEYHETITAQNLEERLHYYQLDNNGIFQEQTVEHQPDSQVARKLFTKRLSKLLMDHVQHAPLHELLAIANSMLYAMKTKDLQIYVTNQQIEDLIGKYGSTNQIDRSTDHDGLYVVQSNVSVSKAAQYVRTNIQDTVTLDANGGATHNMTLRLDYTEIGPIWGLDTYYDYMRIYVPSNSQFLSGDGFTQVSVPYCGGTYRNCAPDVFGDGTMICPPESNVGEIPLFNDSYIHADYLVDKTGPPPNTTITDEQGRNMYSGWVVIPKNCSRTIRLSWYVPPTGHPYSLLIQRQGGTFPIVDLSIQPTPSDCASLKTSGLHYSGVMGGTDLTFTPPTDKTTTNQQNCYPQSKV